MSLLDVPGFNPAEFQLSDDERRRLLLSNILLGVGAGLSGARRGSEIAGLAQGMAQGGALGQQAVSAAQRAQWDKIKGAGEMLDFADRRAKFDDANRWRNFNATYQGSGNATYDALMERAAAAEQAGFPQQAIAMREQAMKYRPKFSTTPQQGVDKDGQPYMYVLDDAGNEKRISAGAKPDWVAADLGGTTQFVNRNTLPASGATLQKTVSPDTVYSGDITKRGQDITIRGQNMTNARALEATARADGGAKPTMVNGQWVFPPDAQNPNGRAVTPVGLTAGEGKPLTESQAKASAFANQMADASRTIAGLDAAGFTGKDTNQQIDIAAAGNTGMLAPFYRMYAGKNAQKYSQAELQWTEAALRFMTGANAPKEEVIRNSATYFPRPGNSPEVIEQKAAARQNMEESIRLAAGSGVGKLPVLPNKRSKTIVQTGTEKGTGRKVVRYSDGTVAYQ